MHTHAHTPPQTHTYTDGWEWGNMSHGEMDETHELPSLNYQQTCKKPSTMCACNPRDSARGVRGREVDPREEPASLARWKNHKLRIPRAMSQQFWWKFLSDCLPNSQAHSLPHECLFFLIFLIFFKSSDFVLSMWMFCLHVYLCHICAQCLRSVRSPGAGVINGYESPCDWQVFCKSNSCSFSFLSNCPFKKMVGAREMAWWLKALAPLP